MNHGTIDDKTWLAAQDAEASYHFPDFYSYENTIENYKWSYKNYFKWFNIKTSKKFKSILEIGPALVSGCEFVDCEKRTIIEPLYTESMMQKHPEIRKHHARLLESNVEIYTGVAEDFDDYGSYEEVWMFNVLQHVKNPTTILEKAMKAKVVRVFEPIDLPVDTQYGGAHPHELTKETFSCMINCEGQLNAKMYQPSGIENFHGVPCYTCAYIRN